MSISPFAASQPVATNEQHEATGSVVVASAPLWLRRSAPRLVTCSALHCSRCGGEEGCLSLSGNDQPALIIPTRPEQLSRVKAGTEDARCVIIPAHARPCAASLGRRALPTAFIASTSVFTREGGLRRCSRLSFADATRSLPFFCQRGAASPAVAVEAVSRAAALKRSSRSWQPSNRSHCGQTPTLIASRLTDCGCQ